MDDVASVNEEDGEQQALIKDSSPTKSPVFKISSHLFAIALGFVHVVISIFGLIFWIVCAVRYAKRS